MEITINSNILIGSIIAIIVIVFSLIGLFCDEDEKLLTHMGYFTCFFFGTSALALVLFGNSVLYSENTVFLTEIPNTHEYYIYHQGDEQSSLQYMEGNKLITDKVNDLEIIYDAKDEPYMEIEEGKSIINQTIEKNVTIHMTIEGNE